MAYHYNSSTGEPETRGLWVSQLILRIELPINERACFKGIVQSVPQIEIIGPVLEHGSNTQVPGFDSQYCQKQNKIIQIHSLVVFITLLHLFDYVREFL